MNFNVQKRMLTNSTPVSNELTWHERSPHEASPTRFPPLGGPLKSGTFLGFFECMYKKWPSRGGGTKIQILMCVWPTFLWPT